MKENLPLQYETAEVSLQQRAENVAQLYHDLGEDLRQADFSEFDGVSNDGSMTDMPSDEVLDHQKIPTDPEELATVVQTHKDALAIAKRALTSMEEDEDAVIPEGLLLDIDEPEDAYSVALVESREKQLDFVETMITSISERLVAITPRNEDTSNISELARALGEEQASQNYDRASVLAEGLFDELEEVYYQDPSTLEAKKEEAIHLVEASKAQATRELDGIAFMLQGHTNSHQAGNHANHEVEALNSNFYASPNETSILIEKFKNDKTASVSVPEPEQSSQVPVDSDKTAVPLDIGIREPDYVGTLKKVSNSIEKHDREAKQQEKLFSEALKDFHEYADSQSITNDIKKIWSGVKARFGKKNKSAPISDVEARVKKKAVQHIVGKIAVALKFKEQPSTETKVAHTPLGLYLQQMRNTQDSRRKKASRL